jgi:hypothetical protein
MNTIRNESTNRSRRLCRQWALAWNRGTTSGRRCGRAWKRVQAAVPWFDWALLAAAAACLAIFPGAIPVLFYHL